MIKKLSIMRRQSSTYIGNEINRWILVNFCANDNTLVEINNKRTSKFLTLAYNRTFKCNCSATMSISQLINKIIYFARAVQYIHVLSPRQGKKLTSKRAAVGMEHDQAPWRRLSPCQSDDGTCDFGSTTRRSRLSKSESANLLTGFLSLFSR